MQAYWPCHLGIDNLNVARTFGRLLDKDSLVKPLPLIKDGDLDLVALVQYRIRARGRETVGVTKAVGFGWWINLVMMMLMLLLTWVVVISLRDARRGLLKVRSHWYQLCFNCVGL